ncbi:hypothetical protein [Hymenobacter koreensis]|uniref:Uncharacterized protein n=1 Tax=Hymenobacter koreensis TaxID=1084523 RepID=A0ABP8IX69_9BACT
MLDFYLLDDGAAIPNPVRLAELPKAGELSEEEFTHLQKLRIIETRLDFYHNFRWSSDMVTMKLQLLLRRYPDLTPASATPDAEAQRFFLILLNASSASTGLLAIAD